GVPGTDRRQGGDPMSHDGTGTPPTAQPTPTGSSNLPPAQPSAPPPSGEIDMTVVPDHPESATPPASEGVPAASAAPARPVTVPPANLPASRRPGLGSLIRS